MVNNWPFLNNLCHGCLCVQEFTLGIAKLIKGSMQDKLNLVFEVWHHPHHGKCSSKPLMAPTLSHRCATRMAMGRWTWQR